MWVGIQQSQGKHVRSFPCEQCSASDRNQQSCSCLRLELLITKSHPWGLLFPLKQHWKNSKNPHGHQWELRVEREHTAHPIDMWVLQPSEDSAGTWSHSPRMPRGNPRWDFKAQHPWACAHPTLFPLFPPLLEGSDSSLSREISSPVIKVKWIRTLKQNATCAGLVPSVAQRYASKWRWPILPRGPPCTQNHAHPVHSAAGVQKEPFSWLTCLGGFQISRKCWVRWLC